MTRIRSFPQWLLPTACSISMTACFLFNTRVNDPFPVDRGGREFAGLKGKVASAYEDRSPNTKVLAVAFDDSDWGIERSPEGVILRRRISAYVGYKSTTDKEGCGVDDIMFAQENTGPNSWAGLRFYAIGHRGRGIACELLGSPSPAGQGQGVAGGAAAGSGGGGGALPPDGVAQSDLTFVPASGVSSLPVVPSESVTILYADQRKPLPAGLWIAAPQGRESPKSALELAVLDEGYPTAEDPHVKVGEVRWSSRTVLPLDKVASLIAAEAGKHGANTVLMVSYRLDAAQRAVALRLSSAQPAGFPAASELLKKAPASLKGYELAGPPSERGLEDFQPVVVEGKRGTCYGVHIALDSFANFTPSARSRLGVTTSNAVALPGADQNTLANAALSVRDFATVLGCPAREGKLHIKLTAKKHAWLGYGYGGMKLQVYTKPIALAELKKMEDLDAAKRRDCSSCEREIQQCRGNDPEHPGEMLGLDRCAPYVDCLKTRSRTLSDCERP